MVLEVPKKWLAIKQKMNSQFELMAFGMEVNVLGLSAVKDALDDLLARLLFGGLLA